MDHLCFAHAAIDAAAALSETTKSVAIEAKPPAIRSFFPCKWNNNRSTYRQSRLAKIALHYSGHSTQWLHDRNALEQVFPLSWSALHQYRPKLPTRNQISSCLSGVFFVISDSSSLCVFNARHKTLCDGRTLQRFKHTHQIWVAHHTANIAHICG